MNDIVFSEKEARKLCDQIVQKAVNLRDLLRKFRDGQGWKALGHASWAVCCEVEFGYTKQHANYLIKTDNIKREVEEISSTKLTDSQAHELGKVPEDKQKAVLDWAVEKADGKPLTAKAIQKAAVDVLAADPDKEEPEDDEPYEAEATQEDYEDDGAAPVYDAEESEPELPTEPDDFQEVVVFVTKWMQKHKKQACVVAARLIHFGESMLRE